MNRTSLTRSPIRHQLPRAAAVMTVAVLYCLPLLPAAQAQPVIISVNTTTGNDTLRQGTQGAITFDVDANGAEVAGIQLFLRLAFSAGNIIGPISDSTNFSFSPAASVLEIQQFSNTYGNGTNPDSILFNAADLMPPRWTGAGELARVTFTPSGTGRIYIDSTVYSHGPVLALDQTGSRLPVVWQKDTIYVEPIACPTNGDANCDHVINAADIIYIVNHVFKGGPPPPQQCP